MKKQKFKLGLNKKSISDLSSITGGNESANNSCFASCLSNAGVTCPPQPTEYGNTCNMTHCGGTPCIEQGSRKKACIVQ